MNSKGKKLKKNQKRSLIKVFVRTVICTVITCGLLMGVLVGCYNKYIKIDDPSTPTVQGNGDKENNKNNKDDKDDKENNKDDKEQGINKNLAVFGVDEDGYRTDVIFIVNFNSQTNEVNLVSVPRDTRIEWSTEQKNRLKELGKGTRSVSKINEMTAYGGIENIRDFTINQLENMFGIKIDNYIILDLNAFRKIVDAIGGVEMDVPRDMYYVDNAGGLHINLKAGVQVLDGEKAEKLVRFRRYPDGDVGRVEMQQIFLKAFADTVMSPKMIVKLPELVKVLFDVVDTDASLFEIPQYYKYIRGFDVDDIDFHILPGEGKMVNGISYFYPYMDEMDEFIQVAFFNKPTKEEVEALEQAEAEAQGIVLDKTIKIEILNGSGIAGIAGKEEKRLEAEGYSVGAVGNYERMDVEETVIYAQDADKAKQLQKYYEGASIEEDETLSLDVQIVLGKNHTASN